MAGVIKNPTIPYVGRIDEGFDEGSMIRIQGFAPSEAKRFNINLQTGPDTSPRDDTALHLSVRLVEGYVARNTYENGTWGDEQGHGDLLIAPGQQFEIILLCGAADYKVAINGQHFCEFPQRIKPKRITHLLIDGDVVISLISHEGNELSSVSVSEQKGSMDAPSAPGYYGPPQGGYLPQGGYGPTQGGYGAPQGGYGPAQGGYGPPQGGYGPPPGQYGPYGPPQQGYGPPQPPGHPQTSPRLQFGIRPPNVGFNLPPSAPTLYPDHIQHNQFLPQYIPPTFSPPVYPAQPPGYPHPPPAFYYPQQPTNAQLLPLAYPYSQSYPAYSNQVPNGYIHQDNMGFLDGKIKGNKMQKVLKYGLPLAGAGLATYGIASVLHGLTHLGHSGSSCSDSD